MKNYVTIIIVIMTLTRCTQEVPLSLDYHEELNFTSWQHFNSWLYNDYEERVYSGGLEGNQIDIKRTLINLTLSEKQLKVNGKSFEIVEEISAVADCSIFYPGSWMANWCVDISEEYTPCSYPDQEFKLDACFRY